MGTPELQDSPPSKIEVTPAQVVCIVVAVAAVAISAYEIIIHDRSAVWATVFTVLAIGGTATTAVIITAEVVAARCHEAVAEVREAFGDVKMYDREILEAIRSIIGKKRGDTGPQKIYRTK